MRLRNYLRGLLCCAMLGLLGNGFKCVDQASPPSPRSFKKANHYSAGISYEYYEVSISKQIKRILANYMKEVMIGGASFPVSVIILLLLLKKGKKPPESAETEDHRDQSAQVQDNNPTRSNEIVQPITPEGGKSIPTQPKSLYDEYGCRLRKLPLEALKFKTKLPQEAEKVINSFPWTKEEREKARVKFANDKPTQEFLNLLKGISYETKYLGDSDPSWIRLRRGANIQTKCDNPDCPSNQASNYEDGHPHYVLIHYPLSNWNLPKVENDTKCPVDSCQAKIKFSSLGSTFMYKCKYYIDFGKYHSHEGQSNSYSYEEEADTGTGEKVIRFWMAYNMARFSYASYDIVPHKGISE